MDFSSGKHMFFSGAQRPGLFWGVFFVGNTWKYMGNAPRSQSFFPYRSFPPYRYGKRFKQCYAFEPRGDFDFKTPIVSRPNSVTLLSSAATLASIPARANSGLCLNSVTVLSGSGLRLRVTGYGVSGSAHTST